jgi:hypothetical protein
LNPQPTATPSGTPPPSSLPRPPAVSHLNEQAAPHCAGEVTSNGCVTPPAPPPNPPVAVTIGNPPVTSPPNGSGSGNRNVPTPCQDLTGPSGCQNSGGLTPGLRGGVPPTVQNQIGQTQPSAPAPLRMVVLPPSCTGTCDVFRALGEVLPDFAEKLENLNFDGLPEVEPPVFGGGPNTLHPFLPNRPLAPTTLPVEPMDEINNAIDLANDVKTLADLTNQSNEPEDYAKNCQDGFISAAWKAFTSGEGSYREKAKAAKDSVKQCIHDAIKHIEDTIANGGDDPTASSEDN